VSLILISKCALRLDRLETFSLIIKMLDLNLSINRCWQKEREMESQTWTLSSFSMMCFPVQSSVVLFIFRSKMFTPDS